MHTWLLQLRLLSDTLQTHILPDTFSICFVEPVTSEEIAIFLLFEEGGQLGALSSSLSLNLKGVRKWTVGHPLFGQLAGDNPSQKIYKGTPT